MKAIKLAVLAKDENIQIDAVGSLAARSNHFQAGGLFDIISQDTTSLYADFVQLTDVATNKKSCMLRDNFIVNNSDVRGIHYFPPVSIPTIRARRLEYAVRSFEPNAGMPT